jgi:MoxR-like ATPase
LNDPVLTTALEGLSAVRSQLASVIVGQESVIELTLTALLSEGHVLFEGVPGLGKTLLARSLAKTLTLSSSRIQFTPDLMPADVIGSTVIEQQPGGNYHLKFEQGPVFAHVVLADEINRASPKTQSALLEAMQERTVTVRGQRFELPRPFLVLATQNPLEMEGTYPLPEAQIDRFLFKVNVEQPELEHLMAIVDRTTGANQPDAQPCLDGDTLRVLQNAATHVVVPKPLVEFASRIVLATQPERGDAPEAVKRWVRYGSGPRGAQALVVAAKARALLDGRFHASAEDIEALVVPCLAHRVALNFDGRSDGASASELLPQVVEAVKKAHTWPAVLQAE